MRRLPNLKKLGRLTGHTPGRFAQQVAFPAALKDARIGLLLATPKP